MRIQTLFGRIAGAANEQWFGISLIIVRIFFGIHAFLFGRVMFHAYKTGIIGPEEPFGPMLHALLDHQSIMAGAAVCLMITGICFAFGVLTRPAAVLSLLMVGVGDILILPPNVAVPMLSTHAGVVAFSLLALSGGLGHAVGLNGIILRNIRRPGGIANAFFG
jgi:hypothetical protein